MLESFSLAGQKILVTGGKGFLGSYVCELLEQRGYSFVATSSTNYDFLLEDKTEEIFDLYRPNIVIHLAARVGGIGANRTYPGTFFLENMKMGLNLIEASKNFNVDKFVHVGTVCSYPSNTEVPFKEDNLWNGFPEETNAPYGIAKKALGEMLRAYKKEFQLNSAYLIPVNLYGPRDNFNPDSSHVVPALVKKVMDAIHKGDKEIVCWGTGNASREFLHARDAAEGIVRAAESVSDPVPINLGSGKEVKISDLVNMITDLCGFKGKVVWDSSKPDGQMRRCLDVSRANQMLGWSSQVDFRDGLKETIDWYNNKV